MKYKYNGQWYDVNIKALDSMPIGSIILYAGEDSTIPSGWMICDGSYLIRSMYADLFSVIGTKYGTGASDDFKLPDLRGKVPVGLNGSDTDFDTLGETGGSKDMQKHSHRVQGGDGHFVHGGTGEGNAQLPLGGQFYQWTTNPWTNEAGTGNSGNLQPYLVVNYIIKVTNTTPTMASVVNTYSTSSEDAYSCSYVNGKVGNVLYSNSTGTTSDFILQDSVTNYKKIEVGYITNDSNQGVKTIYNNGDSAFYTEIFEIWTSSNTGDVVYIKNAQLMFNGTNVLVGNGYETFLTSGTFSRSSSNNISIKYVIGYK